MFTLSQKSKRFVINLDFIDKKARRFLSFMRVSLWLKHSHLSSPDKREVCASEVKHDTGANEAQLQPKLSHVDAAMNAKRKPYTDFKWAFAVQMFKLNQR